MAISNKERKWTFNPDEALYGRPMHDPGWRMLAEDIKHLPARTIDEALRKQAFAIPSAPFIKYTDDNIHFDTYTYSTVNKMVTSTAKYYIDQGLPLRQTSDYPSYVVGLVSVTDLSDVITYLALMRLGVTVLFLSTRISEPAYAHLLDVTNCQYIIYSDDLKSTMMRVQKPVGFKGLIPIIPDPRIECNGELDVNLDPAKEDKTPGWIIHSSGTTGMPKPVPQNQLASMWGSTQIDIPGSVNFTSLPLFHAYCNIITNSTLVNGKCVAYHSAKIPVTARSLLDGIVNSGAEMINLVPYSLQMLVEYPGGLSVLKKMKSVRCSGAGCPEMLGNKLVQEGVKLLQLYGSTECGPVMKGSKTDWRYCIAYPGTKPFLHWEPAGDDNTFELIVLPGDPAKCASNRPDGSYHTGDIFIRHPTNHDAYFCLGRIDDTIVMLNGEKANPLPLELELNLNKYVKDAVCFGQHRTTLGLMIVPSEKALMDGLSKEQIVDAVWESVEIGNKMMPDYAKISKDAVVVLDYGVQYQKTLKGTVKRMPFLKQFEDVIRDHYNKLEGAGEDGEKREMTEAEMLDLVRGTIAETMRLEKPEELKGNTDFFALGMDSFMAIQVRRDLSRKVNTQGTKLSVNIVFEHPTVNSLSSFLLSLQSGTHQARISTEAKVMATFKKYNDFVAPLKDSLPPCRAEGGEHILLTGATGFLGAHLISHLSSLPEVNSITALVRASDPSAAESRINSALIKAHLQLSPSQCSKLTILPNFTVTDPHFGLSNFTYSNLLSTITCIIHASWSVNFNLTLPSFSPHLQCTHNLINFCLTSTRSPTFNFISSISVALNPSSPNIPVPETVPPISAAGEMGYAQSKLVAEMLCASARIHGLRSRVLRVGQLAGDTKHGVWNPTESWPLMVRAALTPEIQALPVLPDGKDEVCSWLPMDTCAATISDIAISERAEWRVYNVNNPKVLHWKADVLPALREAGLRFKEVGAKEWVRMLERVPDVERNPTFKLYDFFRGKYLTDMAERDIRFSTEEAEKESKSLREAERLDAGWMKRVLRFWMVEAWGKAN